MAADTGTWNFPSDAQSWIATEASVDIAGQWQSSDGSPDNGCLEFRITGKNKNPGQSYWEITDTWENLFGVYMHQDH
jgi:hypothetical protein